MNIDRLAPWYRWVEYVAFARALEASRFAFLHRLAGARHILVLGEGDGRALARLLAVAPNACVDVYELSGQMIALARQRIANSPRVAFEQGDARNCIWPPNHYDGVVTFFFLDCFPEAEAAQLVRSIVTAMAPGGLWLVSDFAIPERGWQRLHAQVWTWVMYRFFNIATALKTRKLPGIEKLISDAGVQRVASRETRCGLIRSQVWKNRHR